MVARAIHARSARAARPFIVVDCAEGTLHELESRLFGMVTDRRTAGHERRASERVGVTGAVCRANGGTLFLRNVMEAPTRVQAKLARLLRDREAGLTEERQLIDLDFRPMAAVDAGVDAAIAEERIRRDLYERLAQTKIDVPPFRRRREDLPLIATTFLRDVAARRGAQPKTCSRAAFALLSALPWPGNGKELRTLLETLMDSTGRSVIQLDDLFEHVRLDGLAARVEAGGTLRDAKARFERDWISAVLMKHHGRVGEAAKALGIQRTNLYRKVRQLKVARTLLGPRRPTL
jgi:DNA-binding NtrC family response regulator